MDIPQQSQQQELTHREMYRRSQDDCMVYNPTDRKFIIEWEPGLRFEVPDCNTDIGWGRGMREVKRYLAEWYCRHMKDQLINELGTKKAEELLSNRPKGEDFVTKWHENVWLGTQVPRTDNEQLMSEIYPQLFLGVTREFGADLPQEEVIPVDGKTQAERIMEEVGNRRYTPQVAQEKPQEEPVMTQTAIEKTPEELLREQRVANMARAREAKMNKKDLEVEVTA